MTAGHVLKVINKQRIDQCPSRCADCRNGLRCCFLRHLGTETLGDLDDQTNQGGGALFDQALSG